MSDRERIIQDKKTFAKECRECFKKTCPKVEMHSVLKKSSVTCTEAFGFLGFEGEMNELNKQKN